MTHEKKKNEVVSVWWDFKTCPIPDGLDACHVRRCIESAVRESVGPGPVTIYAVGNQAVVSRLLLEEISSSGILVRHFPLLWSQLLGALWSWERHSVPPATIMLISGDPSLFYDSFDSCGFSTVLRVFPTSRPKPRKTNDVSREWVWKSLLEGPMETNILPTPENNSIETETGEPAVLSAVFYCKVCEISSQTCDDFIHHLETGIHANMKKWGRSVHLDDKGNPTRYVCNDCNYVGYNSANMFIHYRTDEHIRNVEKRNLLSRHKREQQEQLRMNKITNKSA